MTTEKFLEVLREEMDRQVQEHGLILKGEFYDAMAARLILEEEKNTGFFY
jgi:hypothetical protein